MAAGARHSAVLLVWPLAALLVACSLCGVGLVAQPWPSKRLCGQHRTPAVLRPCAQHRAPAVLRRAGEEASGEEGAGRDSGASAGTEAGAEAGAGTDWRAVRARLVELEKGAGTSEESEVENKGFLYATPLIEEGSVLLSAPGDHFALNQQYFHKTVILIVDHSRDFTRGVILNRPTAFDTSDLELPPQLMEVEGADPVIFATSSSQKWNIWCGGDCEGTNTREVQPPWSICLHTLESLADVSRQIIRGVFVINLSDAQRLVKEGNAKEEDFLLLVGYCGWGAEQLQGELDRGDTWTMAAADQRMLLGQLREAQAQARVRLRAASGTISPAELGDGIAEWQQLYEGLGEEYRNRLSEDGVHTDEMLRRWIARCLIPERLQPPPRPRITTRIPPSSLSEGTVLRGSSTAWLLGKPAERQSLTRGFGGGLPGQYLHKAVLLLLRNSSFVDPALLVLLNGPQVGESEGVGVFFGGPARIQSANVFALVGSEQRFQGFIILQNLTELLEMGALEVVEDGNVEEILKAPLDNRWQVAGGRMETLEEAAEAQLGDVQKRKWYSRFLGMDDE